MDKVIIVLVLVLAFWGFGKMNQRMSDRIYEECMAGGKQSQETCYHYAYEQ